MPTYAVTGHDGAEIEVEADDACVDDDGILMLVDVVDEFDASEWHAVREVEDDEGEDEDETAEDLVDRLEETFHDDEVVLALLDALRVAMDADETE